MEPQKISYVSHQEVDTDKWDNCLEKSPNALVYAQSWYLDKVCDRWDALVLGDYQYVMPLTYRKKLGFTYLFQPTYCQQLGIFPTPTKAITQQFLEEVDRLFPFVEINLNAMQLPVDGQGTHEERHNHLLSLQDSYEVIAGNYSKHTCRKLKKAQKNNLTIIKGVSAEEYWDFNKKYLKIRPPKSESNNLRNIIAFALTRGFGQIYGVYSHKNQLCATVFFLRGKNRVTYLNPVSSPSGKEFQSTYFLVDQFIRENAGKNYFIDFEGSMIPGVARFYEGFGATPEKYYQYRLNNLPWWIKWLKK